MFTGKGPAALFGARLSGGTFVIAVIIPAGEVVVTVSRSVGDYVFGLAEEAKPAFPSIGPGFKTHEKLDNLVVDPKPTDGAASRSEFEKGDVVLSVDGRPFADINEVRMYMASFRCGDEIKFRVLRAGQVKDLVIRFDK